MDDVLPRMAHWKPGPQYIGRARHLGVPCRESLFANLLLPCECDVSDMHLVPQLMNVM